MQVGRLVLALQRQTNNVAEYCGLIIGLEVTLLDCRTPAVAIKGITPCSSHLQSCCLCVLGCQ